MKKIIVPVDFSKFSENALETGAFFAKQSDAELIVLHMLELSNVVINKSGAYMQEEALFYMKLAEKRFEEFLDKDYLSNVKVTPIVKHFKVFSEINEVAKNEEVDLIIMGSKGTSSGFKELFIGSNTEKVVRSSDVPVLVVKDEPIETNFTNGVFATDFSKSEMEPVKKAKQFFDEINGKLRIVNINTPTKNFRSTKEINELKHQFVKDTNFPEEDIYLVSDYSVEEGVINFSKSTKADLIIMATHGRRGLAHVFDGSISEDVVNHSKIPVMTFKMDV